MLPKKFFNIDAELLAKRLLGKVIRVRYGTILLSAMIIETEAYYLHEKASHASLGYTQKRKALFMPAGTIYMYYARGGDSLNISAQGKGNAVLIKAAIPYLQVSYVEEMLAVMHQLNPLNQKNRPTNRLCSGQTLLCKALNLKVPIWDQKNFNEIFYIEDVGYQPYEIIKTTRLGIPTGRDQDLMYRFIDAAYVSSATQNPLKKQASNIQILTFKLP